MRPPTAPKVKPKPKAAVAAPSGSAPVRAVAAATRGEATRNSTATVTAAAPSGHKTAVTQQLNGYSNRTSAASQARTPIAARQFQAPRPATEQNYATQTAPDSKPPRQRQTAKQAPKPTGAMSREAPRPNAAGKTKKAQKSENALKNGAGKTGTRPSKQGRPRSKSKSGNPAELLVVPGDGHKLKARKTPKKHKAIPETVALTTVAANTSTGPVATVTELAPRIAEAKRRNKLGQARKVAVRFGAVIGFLAAVWLVGFSPYLALEANRVTVTAESETLVDLDAVTNLALANTAKPLARINTNGLIESIEQLAGVKTVQVNRTWPHGLSVTIESRVPAGAVVTETGFTWVDVTGVTIGEFADTNDLAKLEGPLDQPEVLAAMLVLWQGLPPEFQEQVRVISASASDNIYTTMRSGKNIYWGSTDQLMLKIAIAQALMNRAPHSNVFDVSSPSLPVTR